MEEDNSLDIVAGLAKCVISKRRLPSEDGGILTKRQCLVNDISHQNVIENGVDDCNSEVIGMDMDTEPRTVNADENLSTPTIQKIPGPAGLIAGNDNEIPDRPNSPEIPWYVLCADFDINNNSTLSDAPGSTSMSNGTGEQKLPEKENEDLLAPWKTINIGWIRRNFVPKPKRLWKMPFLAAVIQAVHNSCPEPCLVLGDKTGHVIVNLKPDIFWKYECYLKPGSAIVLYSVGIVSTGHATGSGHYLTVNEKNILAIYSYSVLNPHQVKTTVVNKVTEVQLQRAFKRCKGGEIKSLDEADNQLQDDSEDEDDSNPGTLNESDPDIGTSDRSDSPVPSTSTGITGASSYDMIALQKKLGLESSANAKDDCPRKRKSSFQYKIPQKTLRLESPSTEETCITDELVDLVDLFDEDSPSFPSPAEEALILNEHDALQGVDLLELFSDDSLIEEPPAAEIVVQDNVNELEGVQDNVDELEGIDVSLFFEQF